MTARISFLILALILLGGGLYVRAHNAASAKSQVANIQSLDSANAAGTNPAIASLKSYVKDHMGATAKFTLTGSYQRAVTAANAAAAVAAANARVYAAAPAACRGHTDSITQAECNQRYLAQHLVTEPSSAASATPPALAAYEYNLSTPAWTPDLAGALLLGAAAALVLAVAWPRRRRR